MTTDTDTTPRRKRMDAPWRVYTQAPDGGWRLLADVEPSSTLASVERWVADHGEPGVRHRLMRDPDIVLTPVETTTIVRTVERDGES